MPIRTKERYGSFALTQMTHGPLSNSNSISEPLYLPLFYYILLLCDRLRRINPSVYSIEFHIHRN